MKHLNWFDEDPWKHKKEREHLHGRVLELETQLGKNLDVWFNIYLRHEGITRMKRVEQDLHLVQNLEKQGSDVMSLKGSYHTILFIPLIPSIRYDAKVRKELRELY